MIKPYLLIYMLFKPDLEKRFSPYDLKPIEYLGLVENINQGNIARYRQIMKPLKLDADQCLVIIGSDGKLERHPQSKTEFVIFQNQEKHSVTYNQVLYFVMQQIFRLDPDPKRRIEIKTICDDEDILLSYTYGNNDIVYPDRTINSIFIRGNVSTYIAARKKVFIEISSNEPKSRRIREKMEDQLRQYKRAMKTGVYRNTPIFNLKLGKQFYRETPPLTLGFKPAFIRAVQRKLDIFTARGIRGGNLNIHELNTLFPTATYEKLVVLHKKGILNSALAMQTGEAYGWFLREYHRAQEYYKLHRIPVIVEFNPEEFQNYAEIIEKFANL